MDMEKSLEEEEEALKQAPRRPCRWKLLAIISCACLPLLSLVGVVINEVVELSKVPARMQIRALDLTLLVRNDDMLLELTGTSQGATAGVASSVELRSAQCSFSVSCGGAEAPGTLSGPVRLDKSFHLSLSARSSNWTCFREALQGVGVPLIPGSCRFSAVVNVLSLLKLDKDVSLSFDDVVAAFMGKQDPQALPSAAPKPAVAAKQEESKPGSGDTSLSPCQQASGLSLSANEASMYWCWHAGDQLKKLGLGALRSLRFAVPSTTLSLTSKRSEGLWVVKTAAIDVENLLAKPEVLVGATILHGGPLDSPAITGTYELLKYGSVAPELTPISQDVLGQLIGTYAEVIEIGNQQKTRSLQGVATTTSTTTAQSNGTTTSMAPAFVVSSGPCTVDGSGCAMSPNYPSNYNNSQFCNISYSGPSSFIQVVAFATEACCDKVRFGIWGFGGSFPSGLDGYASGPFTWSSDSSTVSSGWKLCPVLQMPSATTTAQVSASCYCRNASAYYCYSFSGSQVDSSCPPSAPYCAGYGATTPSNRCSASAQTTQPWSYFFQTTTEASVVDQALRAGQDLSKTLEGETLPTTGSANVTVSSLIANLTAGTNFGPLANYAYDKFNGLMNFGVISPFPGGSYETAETIASSGTSASLVVFNKGDTPLSINATGSMDSVNPENLTATVSVDVSAMAANYFGFSPTFRNSKGGMNMTVSLSNQPGSGSVRVMSNGLSMMALVWSYATSPVPGCKQTYTMPLNVSMTAFGTTSMSLRASMTGTLSVSPFSYLTSQPPGTYLDVTASDDVQPTMLSAAYSNPVDNSWWYSMFGSSSATQAPLSTTRAASSTSGTAAYTSTTPASCIPVGWANKLNGLNFTRPSLAAMQAAVAAAAASSTVISGSMTLTVANAAAFIANPATKTAIQKAIATAASVSPDFVSVTLSLGTRLLREEPNGWARGLQAASTVNVQYNMTIPGTSSTTGNTARLLLTATSPATFTSLMNTQLQSAGLPTVVVTQVSAPSVQTLTVQALTGNSTIAVMPPTFPPKSSASGAYRGFAVNWVHLQLLVVVLGATTLL